MEMQEEARTNSSSPAKTGKKDKREQIPIPDFATKIKAPKKQGAFIFIPDINCKYTNGHSRRSTITGPIK